MRKFIRVIPLLAVMGCMSNNINVTANLDYANTSLGFRNSGALSTGRLMLWDLENNSLVTLSTDINMASTRPTVPRDLEATQVRGASFRATGELTGPAKANIEAAITRNLKFTAKDAVRIDSVRSYSAISAAYKALDAEGVSAFRAFRVSDATNQPSKFKYVLLTDEVQASSESLELSKSTTAGAGLTVANGNEGSINISFPSSTTAKCSGTAVTCYLNASVMTVFLNGNGGLDYEPFSFDRADLSAALRDLS